MIHTQSDHTTNQSIELSIFILYITHFLALQFRGRGNIQRGVVTAALFCFGHTPSRCLPHLLYTAQYVIVEAAPVVLVSSSDGCAGGEKVVGESSILQLDGLSQARLLDKHVCVCVCVCVCVHMSAREGGMESGRDVNWVISSECLPESVAGSLAL